MNSKSLIMIGLMVGSIVGGYIPRLWGEGLFSFSSVIFTAIGSIIGIWIAYKIDE